jgi:integrase
VRGHVRKRGSSWTAVIDLPRENGKRRQRWLSGFPTKKAAEQAMREALGRVEAGADIEPSKITVERFLEDIWLPALRVRPTTASYYKLAVDRYIVPRVGGVRLQKLTAPMLNGVYAELERSGRRNGKGLSARSVRHVHAIIRRALADAVAWNLLVRNVAEAARPPRKTRPKIKTWSAEQLRRFLTSVRDDRLYAAWMVAAMTGMRRGEILGLRWSDLDLEHAKAKIERALILVDYAPTISEPKTERGRRTVALDPATVAALRERIERQNFEAAMVGEAWENAEGYVFTDEFGRVIHPQAFTDRFKRYAKAAKLPVIRLHELRHSHATLALEAGVAPKVVSDRLGHASTAFTMDVYSDALPAVEETAAAMVAALVLGDDG